MVEPERFDIIGIGALNVDRLFHTERVLAGGETEVSGGRMSPGGSSANTVQALARLGMRAGFIGAVGDDDGGAFLLEDFYATGVDTAGIARVEGPSGTVLGFITPDGERSLYVLPGANSRLSADDLRETYIRSTRLLVAASFADPEAFPLMLAAFRTAHGHAEIAFSPGSIYARLGLQELAPLIELSDVLFLNGEEMAMLTGTGSFEAGADALRRIGCPLIVVTQGANGCVVVTADGTSRHAAAPVEQVVDTTGAGDSFAAGFLYGRLTGEDIERCCLFGSLMAAATISAVGARAGLADASALAAAAGL